MQQVKTSSNSPIVVDFLDADTLGLPGRIGLTIAAGKRDPARNWDRDLGADLARLRSEYRADVLVSLMEEHEYRMLQIVDLRANAAATGMEVRWFPIVDVAVPRASQMAEFTTLISELVEAARTGKTVVIHCRGGLGRSGLVAASCLVQLGHSVAAAIAATRAARPGAVEVESQEVWVAAFADATRSSGKRSRRAAQPTLDGVRGCLLGGALGDALGYPIEFQRAGEIAKRISGVPEQLSYEGSPVALFSDDTQMTLFVAEGIIRSLQQRASEGAIASPVVIGRRALLRWYVTQTSSASMKPGDHGWLLDERGLHSPRAPGNTCMSALARLATSEQAAATVERPPNDSKGCGAVMRAAPWGLAMKTRASAFELARDTGVLTHGHPSGYLSGAYLAAVIWDLSRGALLDEALDEADRLLASEPGHEELARIIARVRTKQDAGRPSIAELEQLGGGWVGEEALAIALRCVLAHDPAQPRAVETTLWTAVHHGGDSDSTGSIAGNLLGAMLGVHALPERWLAQLELRHVIDKLAHDLYASAVEGVRLDLAQYPAS